MTSFLDHLTEAAQPEKRWYVIHTYSGYEKKVKTNLEHRIETMGMEEKIYQVLVPEEDEIEIRGGQRVTVQKKVFPGYVLVEMILDPESWFVVRNTPGVTSFVGGARQPECAELDDEALLQLVLEELKGPLASGDLVLVLGDNVKRTWKQIIYFNSGAHAEETGMKLPVNIELPETEDFAFGDDVEIISDERGVRIAREEGD